jgi:hypothetical protein
MKIETRQNLPSIDDPRRVVYLMGNTGINDSALTVQCSIGTMVIVPHLLS